MKVEAITERTKYHISLLKCFNNRSKGDLFEVTKLKKGNFKVTNVRTKQSRIITRYDVPEYLESQMKYLDFKIRFV